LVKTFFFVNSLKYSFFNNPLNIPLWSKVNNFFFHNFENHSMETEFNKLNISDTRNFNHKNCSYCNKPFTEELWYKECDPRRIIEGWTSGNPDIDKFIKDTMYNAKYHDQDYLEWVTFDRFTDIMEIGEGGFAKVYLATWIDGKSEYYAIGEFGRKEEARPKKKVALKKLNGLQNMSEKIFK
jgi:hypothetical protein